MLKEFIQKLFGTKETVTTKRGSVKFYNKTKGFGFIKIDDSEEEIFFHKTNLNDRVRENDRVSFDTEVGDKGPAAVNVSKIKKQK